MNLYLFARRHKTERTEHLFKLRIVPFCGLDVCNFRLLFCLQNYPISLTQQHIRMRLRCSNVRFFLSFTM